ncbi:MAG: hypothetical protein HC822_19460, partial [Oscillochloris sp.]|nr:hypothetical protein [Oscillochloris sp.]
MSSLSPSPNPTNRSQQRRSRLGWLVLAALLLALLPISCVSQLALWLVTPQDEAFKDVAAAADLDSAYAPFPGGISFAPIDPNLPDIRATEVSSRERTATSGPVSGAGSIAVAPVVAVNPPAERIEPARPTPTRQSVAVATVAASPTTAAAGGASPSATPDRPVVLPGPTLPPPTASTTSLPSRTNTATATRTVQSTATSVPQASATRIATSGSTATNTVVVPTSGAFETPISTATPIVVAPATRTPTATVLPVATPTNTATVLPVATPTNTATALPVATPTNTATA